MADRDDLPNNPAARGDLHLAHHQSEEGFHRVRTDVHPIRDLFARQSYQQKFQCHLLAGSQVEPCGDCAEIYALVILTFEQDGAHGVGAAVEVGDVPEIGDGEHADHILPSSGSEGHFNRSSTRKAELRQDRKKLGLNMLGEGMALF